ncbi:MAG TPA: hypothetical protein VMW40_04000 [Candidatus Bathyarchaeia archaeon]|nr:hypothetical protein [Candidatus Bathyarchaeia archaeon]
MTDALSSTSEPLVWLQDDVILGGKKRIKMVYIAESLPPEDLKETIESLIETGLSEVEMMREILKIVVVILRIDGRFDALAREVGRYREIVFKEDRCMPFTMIEARAVLSTMRKWQNAIERRLEAQQV